MTSEHVFVPHLSMTRSAASSYYSRKVQGFKSRETYHVTSVGTPEALYTIRSQDLPSMTKSVMLGSHVGVF